jgi:hypothetical protein
VFDATAFSVSVPFYGASLPLLAWVRRHRPRAWLLACVRRRGRSLRTRALTPRRWAR